MADDNTDRQMIFADVAALMNDRAQMWEDDNRRVLAQECRNLANAFRTYAEGVGVPSMDTLREKRKAAEAEAQHWKSRFEQECEAHEMTGRVADALEADGHRLRAEQRPADANGAWNPTYRERWEIVRKALAESERDTEAYRRRAEAAEAMVARVRDVAKLNAIAYRAMWNGDVERVFLDILAIVDGGDAQ